MLKIKDIRELSTEELENRKRELQHEQFNLRIQQKTGQLENPSLIKETRRDVARISTVLSERRIKAAQTNTSN